MLTNLNIIYFSNDWNADNRTSAHHIASQLQQKNRVLYVEASGLRSPASSHHDIKRITKKIFRFFSGAKKINENFYVFAPLLIPYHKYTFVQKINKGMLAWLIKRQCKKLNFKKPLLWIIIPHMVMLANKIRNQGIIYYCVDDFASLPGVNSNAIQQFDYQLSVIADVIFTPSELLYKKKHALNKNTFLSPHGVDIDHFSKVFKDDLQIPDDIKNIKAPIIGFFGLIESWIDLALIKTIAQQRPDWSIVLIGRIAVDISQYSNLKNIYFLQQKPFSLLPNYAKRFDVTIIPYLLNQQVMHANPIKLKEYLAMGKPVVAVRTPEIEKFSHVVAIADNKDEFIKKIEVALTSDTAEKCQQRLDSVQKYTWQQRFKDISAHIQSIILNNPLKRDS